MGKKICFTKVVNNFTVSGGLLAAIGSLYILRYDRGLQVGRRRVDNYKVFWNYRMPFNRKRRLKSELP